MRGALAEIGQADAVLARELEDGRLMLIDGHLRVEEIGDGEIPVLVLDVDEAEADKLLATLDPLAAMAEADEAKQAELISSIAFESDALTTMLTDLCCDENRIEAKSTATEVSAESKENEVAAFLVVVEVGSAKEQVAAYQSLLEQGYACRMLND